MQIENFDILYFQSRMLAKFPLLMDYTKNINHKEKNDLTAPMATTGKTIYYNLNMLKNFTEDEIIFTYAHEVFHIAYDHIKRRNGKNANVWNVATDAVINQILKKEGLPLKKGLVNMPEAINKSAEEMYEILIKNHKDENDEPEKIEEENNNEKQQNQQEEQNQQEKIEEENNNEKQQNQQEEQNQAKNDRQEQETYTDCFNNQHTLPKNHNEWNDGDETENLNEETELPPLQDECAFSKENQQQLQNIAQNEQSKINEELQQKIQHKETQNFLNLTAEKEAITFSWQKMLKKTLNDEDVQWSYRRAESANYFSARVEDVDYETKSETEVLIDTSGSIDTELLKEFLRQLKPILKNSVLRVGFFDTNFYGFHEIKKTADIETLPITGRGGTDLDLPVRCFTKKREINKIIFTDGDSIYMPKDDLKKQKIIWIVYGNENFKPCCGRVIQTSRNEFFKKKKENQRTRN